METNPYAFMISFILSSGEAGNIPVLICSVRPIVRTSRTAFVCASDYDDRTQFHMFEQKNEHG